MLEELSEKHTRIAEFLNSGEWFIGEDRRGSRSARQKDFQQALLTV